MIYINTKVNTSYLFTVSPQELTWNLYELNFIRFK